MKPTQPQEKLKKQFIHSAITITSMEYHSDFHTSGAKRKFTGLSFTYGRPIESWSSLEQMYFGKRRASRINLSCSC